MKRKPSKQQAAVYEWIVTGTGSLQLVARAGCGKTTTLLGAVEVVMENNLGNIVLMAYNKDIAKELKEKIAGMGYDWKMAQAATCHSVGYSAWKAVAGKDILIDEKKVANIIASFALTKGLIYTDCAEVIEKLVGYGKSNAIGYYGEIRDAGFWYGLYDHFGLDMDITEGYKAVDVIHAAILVYEESLNQCRKVIDFDDMILAPLYFKAKFWPKDWVMLDESQDANPARRALAIKMMKPRTGRMIFVGDDRQAIYGFTGADAESMSNIQKMTNAATLHLSVTFRCGKNIVREAQRIVPDIEYHESNAEGIIRSMMSDKLAEQNLGPDDVILCRNTGPLISTCYDLLSKGIPCRVEGREIGTGLIKLAQRWKVTSLEALQTKLETHLEKQRAKYIAKGQEDKIQGLEDQVECLMIVINRCRANDKHKVTDLVADIKGMFGDTEQGQKPNVLTLSTIHKSKGREWIRVFVLGRERYMPSKYAKKEWQQIQEANLEYVAITRAKQELVWVAMGVSEENKEEAPVAAPEAPQAIEIKAPVETPNTPEIANSGAVVYILMAYSNGQKTIEGVSFDKVKLNQMAEGNNQFSKARKLDAYWSVEDHLPI